MKKKFHLEIAPTRTGNRGLRQRRRQPLSASSAPRCQRNIVRSGAIYWSV